MLEANVIDPIIKSAEKLGGLTPAAIFAFMWLVQYVKELRKENQEREFKRKDMEKREQAILSEERQTEAMRSIATNLVMLRDAHNATSMQINTMATILKERSK